MLGPGNAAVLYCKVKFEKKKKEGSWNLSFQLKFYLTKINECGLIGGVRESGKRYERCI